MSEIEVLETAATIEVSEQDGVLEVLEATTYVVEVIEQVELVIEETAPLVLEVIDRGPQGIQGPPGPEGPPFTPLVYTQTTPASAWPIVHNLGRTPGVTLIVDGRVQYTDVSYPDLNTVLITWPGPTAGRAELF